MAVPTIQPSFNAGEISPELYGAVSLAKYSAAATTLRNFVINYKGGAFSRGGLAFVGVCLQSTYLRLGTSTGPPRLMPFQFSITQGYELEFGDQYLRFIFQEGYVLEASVALSGATKANPCQLSVTGTPFANGDWVFISGVVGMTELNGNTYIVEDVASGHFTLRDLQGNSVNSTMFGTYVSGGSVSRLYTVTTPYDAVDLPYLKISQSADVTTLTLSNPVTNNEYLPYNLTRLAAADWTLAPIDFDEVITPPGNFSVVSGGPAPVNGTNANFLYEITTVDALGNESTPHPPAGCYGADIEIEAGSNTLNWSTVAGGKFYNVYRAPPAPDTTAGAVPVPPGSIFGFVGSAYGTQFVDTNSTVDLSQTPPVHRNPFARGQILAVDITDSGSGLTAVTWSISTSTGLNFDGYPAVSGGGLGAFLVTNNGANYAPGDSIAFNGAGFASGAIVFTVNPTNADTITLNGVVWTFTTVPSGTTNTQIQGTLAQTLGVLVSQLSASGDPSLNVARYAVDVTGKDLLITYGSPGATGNSYTLAASVGTPSGATLTGGSGSGSPGIPTATLDIGPQSGTYPGVNAYFQQRLFFANSFNNPDTFWASRTGLYSNFDVSVPSTATDSITASPWTEQVNGIQWLVPMPGGLIAMTGSRAWQILGEGSYQLNVQPITPSTTQAQPQAFNGCSATIQPIVIDYDVLYVEAIGNTTVRDLSWNFWVNIYTGADLTILSSHLFLYRQIVQWAWSRLPYKVLWACCDDGTMLSMTYLKEQEVYGWARHDTQGLVVSVGSVTEPPVNAVYTITQRFPPYAPQGIYVSERMDNRLWQSVEDAYAVDSGVSNTIVSPNATLSANSTSGAVIFTASANVFSSAAIGQVVRMSGGIATVTGFTNGKIITGTWNFGASAGAPGIPFAASGAWTIAQPVTFLKAPHLAGMNVVALADGVPVTGLTVAADGTVALPFAASNVKAGLPFLPQFQTPYLNGNGVMQGSRKVIPAVTVRVAASASFQYGTNQPDGAAQNPPQLGPTWTNMSVQNYSNPSGGQSAPVKYTTPAGQIVTQLWTGDIRGLGGGAEWNSKGQVAIQQPLPLALEITAVMPEVLPGDTPEVGYKQDGGGGQQPPQGGPHRGMIGSRI